MYIPPVRRRTLLAAAWALPAGRALAQFDGNLKFQLDGRIDGPAALFVVPAARGYFKAERLGVAIDPGAHSGATVTRVASGTCDMGFADLAALMEFHANNPTAPNKPVAVMMVYNNTPAAVLALRKTGIRVPADLSGRKLGAPALDAARRTWPIFAKINKVENVAWTSMEAPLRDAMLVRGEVDAITASPFASLPDLEAKGAKADDIIVMPYAQHGVKLYGNAVIAGEDFLKKNPDAVKAFLRAFTRGVREVVANPKAAVAALTPRGAGFDEALELRRLTIALDHTLLTADARADGFGDVHGSRLSLMASQVSDAFGTRERVNPNAVWNGSLLPAASERNIFAATRRS
jgi:NitT/TauT family transport system substrate-binding protein